jgi:Outer membrane protein beta-barrel domain
MHIRPSRPAQRCARFACVAAMLFTAAAVPAGAAEFSFGAGVGAADGRVDCVASFPCDRSGSAWKLFAGYRLSDAVDVHAVYFAGHRFTGGDTSPLGSEFGGTFRVDGIGFTGGYRWGLTPSASLVGRAGFASVHTTFDYANQIWGSTGKSTTQPLLGVGLAYQVTPAIGVGLDYDVTGFKVHNSRGPLQMLGVTAQFSYQTIGALQ